VVTCGIHRCDLCRVQLSDGSVAGYRNLWIPGEGVVYVAPELILHYIEGHHYKPPDEFIIAVLNSPEQSSSAYVDAMQKIMLRWGSAL
jgi:hypothetical protein